MRLRTMYVVAVLLLGGLTAAGLVSRSLDSSVATPAPPVARTGGETVGRRVASEAPTSGEHDLLLNAQLSEEEIAQVFDTLGQVLGLPEITPEELKRKVEEVGKLRFRRDVPIDFMSRERLAQYIHDLFEEEYPEEVAEREELILRSFGLLRSGEDLRTIRARVLNENIAGFYDERPQAKTLFAISSGTTLDLMNQLVLAHELRHAIQDQHVDFGRVLGQRSDYDDRRLAALALYEGDATLLMQRYMSSSIQGGGPLEELLGGLAGADMDGRAMAEMFAGPELRGAPPVVREQLIAPYLEGQALAAEIFRRGGFELLSQKLADPPRSMEQVLHPEKYLEVRDEPIEVSVGVYGEPIEAEGRLGELFIRVLLEPSLSRQDVLESAAGWGGDHYVLMRGDSGAYRLVWHTTWDSMDDAREFYEALIRHASLWFSEAPTPPTNGQEAELQGSDGTHTRVRRTGSDVILERDGLR